MTTSPPATFADILTAWVNLCVDRYTGELPTATISSTALALDPSSCVDEDALGQGKLRIIFDDYSVFITDMEQDA